MVIRSTALQSALAGMNAAYDQLAATAQDLARPIAASPGDLSSANLQEDTNSSFQSSLAQSMSAETGNSLIELNESLTQARANTATAGAAQAMLDELLELGRR